MPKFQKVKAECKEKHCATCKNFSCKSGSLYVPFLEDACENFMTLGDEEPVYRAAAKLHREADAAMEAVRAGNDDPAYMPNVGDPFYSNVCAHCYRRVGKDHSGEESQCMFLPFVCCDTRPSYKGVSCAMLDDIFIDEMTSEDEAILDAQGEPEEQEYTCHVCMRGALLPSVLPNHSPFKSFPICSKCFAGLSSDQLDRLQKVEDAGLDIIEVNSHFFGFWISDAAFKDVCAVYPEIGAPDLPSEEATGEVIEVEQESEVVQEAHRYVSKIKECVHNIDKNFWWIGFYLWECSSYGYYRALDYETIYEFAEKEFDIKRSTTKNLIGIVKTFCINNGTMKQSPSVIVAPKYQEYSQTQLVEMLPLLPSQREKIKPDMTVAEIRAMKAAFKLERNPEGTAMDGEGAGSSARSEREQPEVVHDEAAGNEPCEPERIKESDEHIDPGLVTWVPFNNDEDRKKWLENFREWNLWLDIPQINLKVYRWLFPNGDMITVHTTKYCHAYSVDAAIHEARYFNVIINDEAVRAEALEKYNKYFVASCTFFDIKGNGGRANALDYLKLRKIKGVNMICRKQQLD